MKPPQKAIVLVGTILSALAATALIAGCQSSAKEKGAFRAALTSYYTNKPECLWPNPIRLPEPVDSVHGDQAKMFAALVDAGLLRQGDRYQLTDMGRQVWTADPAQQGYGNFCFNHAHVIAIESFSHVRGAAGEEYAVSYRDSVKVPAWWMNIPSIEKAFPAFAALDSGVNGTATIIKSGNGWKVLKTQEGAAEQRQASAQQQNAHGHV